jgi:Ca2+/Na+ antiporter
MASCGRRNEDVIREALRAFGQEGWAMSQVLSGAIIMANLVVGLFFLRFWRRTHDRLFAMFAAAFWMLAVNRIVLASLDVESEFRTSVYLVRLAGFVLILIAIIDKNRR